jgi:hypothetical protein
MMQELRLRRCFDAVLLSAGMLLAGCTTDGNSERSSATIGEASARSGAGTARAAAFVDQSVPAEMSPDQSYTVSVRMRNTGTATWTAAESYRIGSLNPIDNEVWGFRRVAVPDVIAPGAEANFTFALKAPRTPGEYNFQWRMVQDGVEWFGQETLNVPVVVGGPVAKETK